LKLQQSQRIHRPCARGGGSSVKKFLGFWLAKLLLQCDDVMSNDLNWLPYFTFTFRNLFLDFAGGEIKSSLVTLSLRYSGRTDSGASGGEDFQNVL
jgi:hypothetical protein